MVTFLQGFSRGGGGHMPHLPLDPPLYGARNLITAVAINVLINVMTDSILGIFVLRARETIGLRRVNA